MFDDLNLNIQNFMIKIFKFVTNFEGRLNERMSLRKNLKTS